MATYQNHKISTLSFSIETLRHDDRLSGTPAEVFNNIVPFRARPTTSASFSGVTFFELMSCIQNFPQFNIYPTNRFRPVFNG